MSVVGPRPEMIENVDEYTKELPEFSYRLRVKAGLTGYAQIDLFWAAVFAVFLFFCRLRLSPRRTPAAYAARSSAQSF